MVPTSIQLHFLWDKRHRWIAKSTYSTQISSANNKSILENGLWAGGSSLRGTRQACFLSPLNPHNLFIKTANDRLDRTSSWTKNGTFEAKQSPWYCIYYFNLRPSQNVNLVLHQISSDAVLFVRQRASKRPGRPLLQVEFLFEGETSDINRGDRTDVRKSGQPEEPETLNERDTQKSFSFPVWWSKSCSLQTNRRWSTTWWRHFQKVQEKSSTTLYHIEMQNLMLRKTVTWNEMKFLRSKIAFNECLKMHQYQRAGEPLCTCGSRQINESTVDVSCTLLEFTS